MLGNLFCVLGPCSIANDTTQWLGGEGGESECVQQINFSNGDFYKCRERK